MYFAIVSAIFNVFAFYSAMAYAAYPLSMYTSGEKTISATNTACPAYSIRGEWLNAVDFVI